MSRRELEALFDDEDGSPPLYESDDEELAAIADHRKAAAMYLVSREKSGNGSIASLVGKAADLDLYAIFWPTQNASVVCAFVTRREEMWRAAAFDELWRTRDELALPWSAALEAVESSILGYSREETTAWLADRKFRRPERGATVYAVVAHRQLDAIEASGFHCLPPELGKPPGLDVFAATGFLQRGAHEKIEGGHYLVRVGVSLDGFRLIFGTTRRGLIERTIDDAILRDLNALLFTNVEVLGPSGWNAAIPRRKRRARTQQA